MDRALLEKRKIGSSDAPVIMGVSPWKTQFQLWEEKALGKESYSNSAMRRGTEMEESARRCFEKKMGIEVFAKPVVHKNFDWMTANLDGIDLDNKIMVEIKCPGKEDHITASGNRIPEKYFPQLQHQLEVTGLQGMYYFSFDGTDGCIVEVQRDDSYIKDMILEEKRFWDCILKKIAPELTEKDYYNMDGNEKWTSAANSWIAVSQQLKSLEEKEKNLRNELILLANDKNAQGNGVRLRKSTVSGSVDYSKIPELKNVNTELYRKNSFTKWTLTGM